MLHTLTADQWVFVISELIRVTKPGGYIELFEPYTTRKGIGPKYNEFLDLRKLIVFLSFFIVKK